MALRASPTINRIRSRTPFTDFRSPSEYASALSPTNLSDRARQADSGLRGFGSRHRTGDRVDNSEFSGVEAISFNGPTIHIETSTPFKPVPITIAGVAVLFISPGFVDRSLPITTRYASPRVPDPVPAFKVGRLMKPTPQQIEIVANALCDLADVHALNFYDYYLVVELRWTDRVYAQHSLPGRVAGITTFYHHSQEPYWKGCTNQLRVRVIDPDLDADAQDTTNYLSEIGHLCPGVRLCSTPATTDDEQCATSTISTTTAGVLLRNSSGGQVRMSASEQGLRQSNEVHHPSPNGSRIGSIDERRADHLEVALVQLDPSVHFTNAEYFQANPPKRLLRSAEIQRGRWFVADGMSTGLVYLMARGERIMVPPRLPGRKLNCGELREERIFYALGPTGGIAGQGLRGAPLVEADPGTGGVAGFVRVTDGEHCFAAVLDELIDCGWGVI